jgi:hypothetical protein
MQGSMKTDRNIVRTAGLLAVALFAAAPVTAHAGPLLSGYGGPGQGNQAILGSTLLGGGSGGGSTGAGGGTGQAATATSAGALASGSSATATRGSSGTGHTARAGHAAAGLRARNAAPGAGALKPVSYPTVEPTGGASGGLSLSAADISFVVLAAAALAITGALTRRIVRTRPAKGH